VATLMPTLSEMGEVKKERSSFFWNVRRSSTSEALSCRSAIRRTRRSWITSCEFLKLPRSTTQIRPKLWVRRVNSSLPSVTARDATALSGGAQTQYLAVRRSHCRTLLLQRDKVFRRNQQQTRTYRDCVDSFVHLSIAASQSCTDKKVDWPKD